MRTPGPWLFVALLAIVVGARQAEVAPLAPPQQRATRVDLDRAITLHVEVDETFVAQHGEAVEQVVREAIAIHNLEWRRYRREWFQPGALTVRPSGSERDASYVLARFLHRTTEEADVIHVNIVGRQLEVYTSGTHAVPIGGLAYRGSDAVLISAAPGVVVELMADSPGPMRRETPRRAPMVIREKLFRARAALRHSPHYAALHELLLHEPSPANPAYVKKKRALLAAAGADEPKIASVLGRYEIDRQRLRDDREVRHRIAEHYWRANDAIKSRDYDAADVELEAIRAISASTPNVHMLVSAVERKARRRR